MPQASLVLRPAHNYDVRHLSMVRLKSFGVYWCYEILPKARLLCLPQMLLYGNVGYGEFKGGIKKTKMFCPKHDHMCFKKKNHILKNGQAWLCWF